MIDKYEIKTKISILYQFFKNYFYFYQKYDILTLANIFYERGGHNGISKHN